jgi:site-specific DNA-cytosine methylase
VRESGAMGLHLGLAGGVVVVELFGGLCAGLEACLRNGWKVVQYVYVDKDDAVRRVAAYRVAGLAAAYPDQLPLAACEGAFTRWPQDVDRIRAEHVEQLKQQGRPCVLWAGWECQDLSPAGSGKGLAGRHSSTFFALHKVLVQMQEQLGDRLGYVLENTAMDVPWQRSGVVREDFRRLQELLGPPLQLDAAQFGSRAHRLRCYWTNLAAHAQMDRVLHAVARPAGRLVQDVLGPGRVCRQVKKTDSPPFYVCNVAGEPMQALPTLMATVGSYAFRGAGQGTIWDAEQRGSHWGTLMSSSGSGSCSRCSLGRQTCFHWRTSGAGMSVQQRCMGATF